jgi:hypothetical protein
MLLGKAVDERVEYESAEAGLRREEEKRILLEDKKMFERRKEMDVALQKQLRQDMDAVCTFAGTVKLPRQSDLVLWSCNAVHRCALMESSTYREGDYYCMACRHSGTALLCSRSRSSKAGGGTRFQSVASFVLEAGEFEPCSLRMGRDSLGK